MLAASVSRAERALLLDCVVGWREYVGEVRRQSALLEVHSARLLAFNTQCILDEWLHTAHRLRHQRRLVHDLRHLYSIRRLRCIFEIWRTEAGGIHGSEFLAREAVGHAHERFVSSRIKRRALFAWFALAISKRRTLQVNTPHRLILPVPEVCDSTTRRFPICPGCVSFGAVCFIPLFAGFPSSSPGHARI
jgi:uncharacterized protein (DUF2267 family)